MQRGYLYGSYIMPEFCEVGYSVTLARARGHNFKGWGQVLAVEGFECTVKWQTEKKASSHSNTDVFLTALHSIPDSDSASEAPLYLESEHEATVPKTSLRSATQQNTQTQGDPAKLFLLVSSEVPRVTHVAVLQCLPAIVINCLQLCIPAQHFQHVVRLSQSAQSVPSSKFFAHTLRGGIQALLSRCTSLPIIACSSVALSKCLQIMGQHRPTRVHTRRDAGSVFVWVMSKNPWHSSPCPQRRRLVHQLHSDRFLCHQVGCIIHHPHVI